MYPYLRWLRVVRASKRDASFTPLSESVLSFRVWPGDLDFFGHMNNGRYLSLMDSGRWDIMGRLGLIPILRRNRCISVLGGATIQYQRPLAPFQRFRLQSRIVGWDAKWFYIEQRFEAEGRTVATAWVRGLIRAPGRSVPTREVLEWLGLSLASPELPEPVRRWIAHLDSGAPSAASSSNGG